MSDKDEVVTVEKEEEEVEVVVQPTYTPAEEEAMSSGWLPKDQWEESGRNPDEWRTAKEFNERGEFFRTIHQQKREIKQTQAKLDAMQKHHQFVFDQAYRKAKADLKKELREARRNEDFDRFDQLEEEIETLDQEYVEQKTQITQGTQDVAETVINPDFEMWKARNRYYETDVEMRDEVDVLGYRYLRKNPGAPAREVLKYVDEEMVKKFPEKFGIRRAAPNAVGAVNRTGKPAKKAEYQMDATEETLCNDFVSMGLGSREDYIKSLKQAKGEK